MKIRDINNDFKMYFADRLIIKTGGLFKEGLPGCCHGLSVCSRQLSEAETEELLDLEIEPHGCIPSPGSKLTIMIEGNFPYRSEPVCYPAYSYYTGEPLSRPDTIDGKQEKAGELCQTTGS